MTTLKQILDRARLSIHLEDIQLLVNEVKSLREALEFYGDDMSWLYNQISKQDCEQIFDETFRKRKIPKGLEFEAGGKRARLALQESRTRLGE